MKVSQIIKMKQNKPLETCSYGKRTITVVDGVAFYQSTGHNSGHKATWFPFFGIDTSVDREGWMIKPSDKMLLNTMMHDDTLYFVNSNVNIDHLTWDQIPLSAQKSVLLLQCTPEGALKARYISPEYNKGHSFIYGENTEISPNHLDALFGQKTILSLTDIQTTLTDQVNAIDDQITHITDTDLSYEALTPKESSYFNKYIGYGLTTPEALKTKYDSLFLQEKIVIKHQDLKSKRREISAFFSAIQHLHAIFYQAIFEDLRLSTLPIIYGDVHEGGFEDYHEPDLNPAERFCNLPMLEISHRLYKADKEMASEEEPKNHNSEKLATAAREILELIEEKDVLEPIELQRDPAVFEHRTAKGMNSVNAWILNHGGLLLSSNSDPLTLFKRLIAFDQWVLIQKLNRNNVGDIFDGLRSLGISDKEIKRSIKRADTFIESEIKKLVHHICKQASEYKKYDEVPNVDHILRNQLFDPFIKLNERAALQKTIDNNSRSLFKYDSLVDNLIQFLKGLFKQDRISVLTRDLSARFVPTSFSDNAFFKKEVPINSADDAQKLSSSVGAF